MRCCPPLLSQIPASVASVPQLSSAGSGLQHRGPSALPRLEQQEPPQALSTMGGTVRRCGGAPTRHLQAQDHRWQSLHQCVEYRTATSLLPLIYEHFLLSVSLSTLQSLVTLDPSNGRGSGLTRGLIRAYLSGRHSLCLTLSHVKT